MRIILFFGILTVSFVLFPLSGCVAGRQGAEVDYKHTVRIPACIMEGVQTDIKHICNNITGESDIIK